MKTNLMKLAFLAAAGLLAACSGIGINNAADRTQVFPAATNSFLFEGNTQVDTPNSPVLLAGVPTVAGVFKTPPSATPFPSGFPVTSTRPSEPTETPLPSPAPYTVVVYGESLNPNWEVRKDARIKFDLKSSKEVHQGNAAISLTPAGRGDANLFIAVSNQTQEEYQRDQVAKLSFWLYSPKTLLYLDQFFITVVGSKHIPYWSAEDQKVLNYLSVFHQISLDQLGFDRAIPANTWVKVEIDFDKVRALAPEYQYITGISFKNATTPAHMLLIDDINLTLLSTPPTRQAPDATPYP